MPTAEARRRPKAVISVEQLAELLDMGRSTAYEQAKAGGLPAGIQIIRVGTGPRARIRIGRKSVEDLVGADRVAAVVDAEDESEEDS
jgi:predicted DNA-binding transcriptional regulator AlpA